MNRHLGLLTLALMALPRAILAASSSADYVMTKNLTGVPGLAAARSADGGIELSYALGEQTAGPVISAGDIAIYPGYFGAGRLGAGPGVRVEAIRIAPGAASYKQDELQVGVPVGAPVEIAFSVPVDTSTLRDGIRVAKLQDRMAIPREESAGVTFSVDDTQSVVRVWPDSQWEGNTLYAVTVNGAVLSSEGYPLIEDARDAYVTMIDPGHDNLVLQPMNAAGTASAAGVFQNGGLTLTLPASAVRDYAAIVSAKDPIGQPLAVDPAVIAEANRKALAGNPYHKVLAMREIAAYGTNGERLTRLSKSGVLTLGVQKSGTASGAPALRAGNVALYKLDQKHQLWVKLPASRVLTEQPAVSAPISDLSVYALIADAQGSAADVVVFPQPWQPNGPRAGAGPGQTGTEAGGITFSNLPSECRITIYTVAGERVRELTHSDLSGTTGQETWDVKTDGGQAAASGIYLWRVESSVDSKSGKLAVIR